MKRAWFALGGATTALVILFLRAAPLLAKWLIVRAAASSADALVLLPGPADQAKRNAGAMRMLHQGRAKRLILTNAGLCGGWSRSRLGWWQVGAEYPKLAHYFFVHSQDAQ